MVYTKIHKSLEAAMTQESNDTNLRPGQVAMESLTGYDCSIQRQWERNARSSDIPHLTSGI